MELKTKYVLKGISLTILSAIFAVFGLVVAVTENFIGGVLIVIGSSVFWGYACLLSEIANLRLKRNKS
jgi:polyferredoxin